jgi:hypothetical protein
MKSIELLCVYADGDGFYATVPTGDGDGYYVPESQESLDIDSFIKKLGACSVNQLEVRREDHLLTTYHNVKNKEIKEKITHAVNRKPDHKDHAISMASLFYR